MKITNIQMEKVDHLRVLANFDVTFDNCFVVHNISLIKRDDGSAFLAFYSRKNAEGKFINICHPINHEFRKEIEETLIGYYNEQLNNEE